MGRQRRRFSTDFKAGVALEAIREQHTISELATEYGSPSQSDSRVEETPLERTAPGVQQSQRRRVEQTLGSEVVVTAHSHST
jgi:transposase-like protein